MSKSSRDKLISAFTKRLKFDQKHRSKTPTYKIQIEKARNKTLSLGYQNMQELFAKGTDEEINTVEFTYIYS